MTAVAPRGFTFDRNDGRPVLPGNLHTNRQLSQWLDFSQPSRLRLFTGKVELGQGILTALSIIAADELDLSLEQVHIVSASTLEGPDEGMTSSSISVQDSGSAIRHACAEVRFLALQEAAQHHGVPVENLCVEQGRFTDTQGRNLGNYWDWLKNISLHREYEGLAKPKSVEELKLHGSGKVRRIDLFEKIMGQPRFIHDLRLPGMQHGRILRAPSVTARLVNPDQLVPANLFETGSDSSTHLVVDGRFIGVVALSERDAEAALTQLQEQVAWHESPSLPDMHNLADFLRAAPHETTNTLQKGRTSRLTMVG